MSTSSCWSLQKVEHSKNFELQHIVKQIFDIFKSVEVTNHISVTYPNKTYNMQLHYIIKTYKNKSDMKYPIQF